MVALGIIVIVAQLLGQLAVRCQQPSVIGEIIGGILLGPSLLGKIAPGIEQTLFGGQVRSQLELLGQVGLVLFLFLVGLEFNPRLIQGRITLASRITAAGIVLPLILGIWMTFQLEGWFPGIVPANKQVAGAVFMGIAMSITTFAVLVLILRDRGLEKQPLGALAITSTAIGDAVSWILFAGVVSYARSNSTWGFVVPLIGTALWCLFLFVGLKPLRHELKARFRQNHKLNPLLQALVLGGVMLSAAVTDWLGVHLIFGAFLWGLAMPRDERLSKRMGLRLETVVMRVLLPLFFVISGLNTRIDSLNSPSLWGATFLVIGVAVVGKYLGTWGIAKLNGLNSRESQALGWLMNTRGLTEIVILNVGLMIGVISTELFTMGVIMALATTVITGPFLGALGYQQIRSGESSPLRLEESEQLC